MNSRKRREMGFFYQLGKNMRTSHSFTWQRVATNKPTKYDALSLICKSSQLCNIFIETARKSIIGAQFYSTFKAQPEYLCMEQTPLQQAGCNARPVFRRSTVATLSLWPAEEAEWVILPYLSTPPLGQDMTQGQFLNGVLQVWIQSFPSSKPVASSRLKNTVCPTIYP